MLAHMYMCRPDRKSETHESVEDIVTYTGSLHSSCSSLELSLPDQTILSSPSLNLPSYQAG